MRYRPFGRFAGAASSLSLTLTDAPMRAADRVGLVHAALEAGVNTFELRGRDPDVAAALGQAISSLERRLVFVIRRVGWSPDRRGGQVRDLSPVAISEAIDSALATSGLGYLDVAILEAVEGERLPAHVMPCLRAAKAEGRVRMLGVAGEDAVEPHVRTGEFEVLAAGFNLLSGWPDRHRLTRAVQADMSIIGCDYHPADISGAGAGPEPQRRGPLGLGRLLPAKERPRGAYAFLERTHGWTPEEICLGYALTEPSLATIQAEVREPGRLQALAAVVERDLPVGLAAQIEIARFSTADEKQALAKRRLRA